MDFAIIVLVLVCVANLFLGLFVLIRDPRSRIMQSFFAITIFISLWATSNYLTENASDLQTNNIFNRLAYFFGFLGILSPAIFSSYFTKRKARNWLRTTIAIVAVLAISALSLTSYVAGEVTKQGGKLHFTTGPLIILYVGAILCLTYVIIRNFNGVLRHGSSSQRNQARIITAALTVSIVIGTLTNVVLPLFLSSFASAKYGPPVLSLFLIATIAYAIVRHKLFDIRLVIARSLAYIFTLSTLVATLSVFGYLLTAQVFAASDNQTLQFIVTTALLVVASLTFGPIKHFFNRVTNKFFYQDAYEPQILLDEFNKTLVSEIQLDKLLKKASTVIQTYLKAEYAVIGVQKTTDAKRYVGGTVNKKYDEEDLQKLIAVSPSLPFVVIAIDYLDEEYADLKTLFNKNEVAMVVRLVNASSNGDPDVGYIILGQKKSGNIYNKQDIAIMEILANELLLAIQNALQFEEIEQFNITLQEKVEDATRQLRQTNAKLRQLDETKDEFISMASHQLRTPLTAVKGYLSMVLEGDSGKITNSQQKLLDQAFVSSQRMVYLIADLLNVSRLKTGKFIIEAVPTNLAELVRGEMEQLIETAASRNLELTYDMPDNFPVLMLDEIKTRQVVMNFIDNAIYYTLSGGHIRVVVEDKGETIEFRVEDDGVGVPKSEQHHLFTKFFRAGNAKKARPDGTGLGLFMAKKVIVAQGGAIIFHSVEGKGSTFGFSFAKSKLQPRSRV